MRHKKDTLIPFEFFSDTRLPKSVRRRQDRFKAISKILDANPGILDLVHGDLCSLSTGLPGGRSGDYTSDTILRALIVHFLEGLSLRETTIRIAESNFLQGFIRISKRPMMDHSFLGRAFKALQPETVKRVTEELCRYGVNEAKVDPTIIRTDSTVVETNIHYPTDSSLLNDTYQTIARLFGKARKIQPCCCSYRFHCRKIKKLHLTFTAYSASKTTKRKRWARRSLRKLIARVAVAVAQAESFCQEFNATDPGLMAIVDELHGYLPAMGKVVTTAQRVHIANEFVPASEKVFSIFEPHTELIKRGRRSKPVEFGHMIWLSQTQDRFILDFEAMERKIPDAKLTEMVIDRHAHQFGVDPEVVAADKGYCPAKETYKKLDQRIDSLAIPRRTNDFSMPDMAFWQAFRAGIEGTISSLKRAFRLSRCMYRGFKSYAAALGMGVFAHNLVVLAKST
jgi:IS5 family transposase